MSAPPLVRRTHPPAPGRRNPKLRGAVHCAWNSSIRCKMDVAKTMIPSRSVCQACSADRLHEIEGFGHLPGVTSDSKAFRAGGRLFVCAQCGLVQKIADPAWLREISEIYRDYDMYHQSAAFDQPVFDPESGRPSGRCEVLARRLRES